MAAATESPVRAAATATGSIKNEMSKYQIAGHVVSIQSADPETANAWGLFAYQGDKPAEAVFTVSPETLAREGQRWLAENRTEIENWILYRSMAQWLLARDTLMLHAAAVALDGWAYVFAAPSGTGKSTHANLWLQHFGKERAVILNDDKPLIRLDDHGRFFVCGSLWHGKENKQVNADVPLRAICRLTQAKENHLSPLGPGDAAACLLGQSYLPDTPEELDQGLKLLDRLVRSVPAYSLACNISEEAAEIAWSGMKGADEP